MPLNFVIHRATLGLKDGPNRGKHLPDGGDARATGTFGGDARAIGMFLGQFIDFDAVPPWLVHIPYQNHAGNPLPLHSQLRSPMVELDFLSGRCLLFGLWCRRRRQQQEEEDANNGGIVCHVCPMMFVCVVWGRKGESLDGNTQIYENCD